MSSKKSVVRLTVDDYNMFTGSDERTPQGDAEVTRMLSGDDWVIIEEDEESLNIIIPMGNE